MAFPFQRTRFLPTSSPEHLHLWLRTLATVKCIERGLAKMKRGEKKVGDRSEEKVRDEDRKVHGNQSGMYYLEKVTMRQM
jgi:hypothetical protein